MRLIKAFLRKYDMSLKYGSFQDDNFGLLCSILLCVILLLATILSYNKATNFVIAKRTHRHARVACYTFSERSWHADPHSMEKWVTPLKAVA